MLVTLVSDIQDCYTNQRISLCPVFFSAPHPTLLSSFSCSFLFECVSDASQIFCCRYLTNLGIYTPPVFHLCTCSRSALIYPVYVHLNVCIASHFCRRVVCVICYCMVQAVDKFSITLFKNDWELLFVHHYWSFDRIQMNSFYNRWSRTHTPVSLYDRGHNQW